MNFYDEIKEIATQLNELYELKYDMVKPKVIEIIKKRIVDINIIEKCLDETLNIPTDKGYELHSLLCRYYSTINPKNATFYINEYYELWDNEIGDTEWKDIKK